MRTIKTLRDLYTFPGFRARATLKPHPDDSQGYIITLERRQKKLFVPAVAQFHQAIVTVGLIRCVTLMLEQPTSILSLSIAFVACPQCNAVKRETLSMLAQSARFTRRFEDRIGELCREMTIKRVAELNNLSWDQVCRMEKSCMRRLLADHPPSLQLRTIGVDEISIHKGHSYAIVVADLDQRRPIWLMRSWSH